MRLIAILFCACVSLAQAAGVTVQTLDVKGKNARGEACAKGQMTLPVVKASQAADEALVQRINDRLAFLSTDGTESQQFTVSRNDGRLLTIAFDSEGCGAYCENYSTYYSFDLQDGTVLTAANLFTPAGLQTLTVRLRQEQITRYTQQLATLGKELKAARAKGSKQAAQKRPAASGAWRVPLAMANLKWPRKPSSSPPGAAATTPCARLTTWAMSPSV